MKTPHRFLYTLACRLLSGLSQVDAFITAKIPAFVENNSADSDKADKAWTKRTWLRRDEGSTNEFELVAYSSLL